jgi:hypothetical protein
VRWRELDTIIDELSDDTLDDEEAFDEDDRDSDPQDPIDLTIDEFLAREAVLCGPWWPGRGRRRHARHKRSGCQGPVHCAPWAALASWHR